ncbi:hypothetical protein [Pseudomonas sp.]|uniref:hypothetical protein n=1 Tax=Pseudomonas sp. TaxID=306 RepID=UPI003BB03728
MTRPAFVALLFSAFLGTQALAGSTGPTNSNPDTAPATPALPGANTGTNPTPPTLPDGSDPRTQGNDSGRQGGADTDGTRQDPMEGARPQTGSGGEGNADSN